MLKDRLMYNNVFNKKSLDDLAAMSTDEYLDYIDANDKYIESDEDIILKSGLSIDEIFEQEGKFNDRLAEIINNNNINIKSKPNFFKSIANNDGDIRLIVEVFICDMEYIFSFKKIIRSQKKKENMARFLKLKDKINDFEETLKFIKETEENYDDFLKKVLKNKSQFNREEIKDEHKDMLKKLFYLYISDEVDNEVFDENIEYIHKFCTLNEERKRIYPALMFRILTKYSKKIAEKHLMISTGKLLNYKEYIIYENNGKNYKTNSNYIQLFFELCNYFCESDNIAINFYMFEKYCNLGKWYWIMDNSNKEFKYSYESLIDTMRSTYDFTFEFNSDYYDENYNERGIMTEYEDENGVKTGKTKTISEDEYLDQIINDHLTEFFEYSDEYMIHYYKGRSKSNKYVEQIAEKLLNYVDEDLRNDKTLIRHMCFNVECAFHNISNNVISIWLEDYFKRI